MALSKNQKIFYEEIFPKAQYDPMLEQYRINVGHYILLQLNKRQFRFLENICKSNNIYLEKLPEKLSVEGSNDLFKKLYDLKQQLETTTDISTRERLEKEIYSLRIKLFEGHMKTLYIILYSHIPDLEESEYKEDVIQIGYEYLLLSIDNYNPHLSVLSFNWYLREFSSKNIIRKAIGIMNKSRKYDYNSLLIAQMQLQDTEHTEEDVAKKAGLTQSQIDKLTSFEHIINPDSLEELSETDESSLIDETQEETVKLKLLRDKLIAVIDTLPNEYQKEVTMLLFGLNDKTPYSIQTIGAMLGISRQRALQHRDDALEKLRQPARLKYIRELMEGYSQISIPQTEYDEEPLEPSALSYEKLEYYLIKKLPETELLELINQVEEQYRDLLLEYFNLKETNNNKEAVSFGKYQRQKRNALKALRIEIKKRYILDGTNDEIQTSLDYLMYNYLSRHKIKKRSK